MNLMDIKQVIREEERICGRVPVAVADALVAEVERLELALADTERRWREEKKRSDRMLPY